MEGNDSCNEENSNNNVQTTEENIDQLVATIKPNPISESIDTPIHKSLENDNLENLTKEQLANESLPQVLERQLPRNNCPEKIVIVFDACKENSTMFQLSEGSQYTPLCLTKRVLRIFVLNKLSINHNHQFALIVLKEEPLWVLDFTSNSSQILHEIDQINEEPTNEPCNLSMIFDLINRKIEFPPSQDMMSVNPPPFTFRTIIMYGRSHCIPMFLDGNTSFHNLIQNPYFYLDVIYTHETPSDDNKCEGIFDLLCDLDEVGWSYIYEVARNATKYHNYFGKLLAHPLQRPVQKDCNYTFMNE